MKGAIFLLIITSYIIFHCKVFGTEKKKQKIAKIFYFLVLQFTDNEINLIWFGTAPSSNYLRFYNAVQEIEQNLRMPISR